MGILRKMFYTDYICQMKIINNMNERIDLTKILKDCPRGTKLYCPIYGEVEFVCIDEHEKYPIKVMVNRKFIDAFSRKGFIRPQYNIKIKGNLFPSEVQYDWSKFTAPWYKKSKFDPKTLKSFDKVLVRDYSHETWRCDFFSHRYNYNGDYPYITIVKGYTFCIPYNDDTKHLVGTTDEAPEYYRYWED